MSKADKEVIATIRTVRIMDPEEAEENERQYREGTRRLQWRFGICLLFAIAACAVWLLLR
jgi:hypothetical protein